MGLAGLGLGNNLMLSGTDTPTRTTDELKQRSRHDILAMDLNHLCQRDTALIVERVYGVPWIYGLYRNKS